MKNLAKSKGENFLSVLMGLIIILVALSVFSKTASLIAGVTVALAIAFSIFQVSNTQRYMAFLLIGSGTFLNILSIFRGGEFKLDRIFSINQDIIAMILGVSFIVLVTNANVGQKSKLRGKSAVIQTILLLHFLGSIINLSVITIFAEKLKISTNKISLGNALLLSRGYTSGAFWSPFWAASATALALAPKAEVHTLILCGLILAAFALTIASIGIIRRLGSEVNQYEGYSLTPSLLAIPASLVAMVLIFSMVFPNLKTTIVVELMSLSLTGLMLLIFSRQSAREKVKQHVWNYLPRMRGELILFAGAGVLNGGLTAYFQTATLDLPLTNFSTLAAWGCTLLIVFFSSAGIHPIITMGVISIALQPISPNPTLLAISFCAAWGIAAAWSPTSGPNLFLTGRFQFSSSTLLKSNVVYVGSLLVMTLPVLFIAQALINL
jgi:hypothetical protein